MTPGYSIDRSGGLPDHAHVVDVPFFAQKAYQCGPAALAMTLQWSGVSAAPDDLVPFVYTPKRKGSLQSGLMTASRRHGRLAYPFEGLGCLLGEIAAGRPVIVLQNLGLEWIPKWHYAVVIGYDLDARTVIMHSGLSARRSVGLSTFVRTWRRAGEWGLLTLPADMMPICSEAPAYLQSALGLQQAGFALRALTAFENAAQRWPGSLEAAMALGNAQYGLNMTHAALRSFEQALAIDPSNGPALNNLAHILADLGDYDKAEAAARKALAGGGPLEDLYRRTLKEILNVRQQGDGGQSSSLKSDR